VVLDVEVLPSEIDVVPLERGLEEETAPLWRALAE
jgi:hypothetical protein